MNWDLHFDVSVDGVGNWLLYNAFHRILKTQNRGIKNTDVGIKER